MAQEKNKHPFWDYSIQLIFVLSGILAGYLLGLPGVVAKSSGAVMVIVTSILAIYTLKRFDARPDIEKARAELSTNLKEIKELKKDYEVVNQQAQQAKIILSDLRVNLQATIQNIQGVEKKLGIADSKANAGLLLQFLDKLKKN
ncbi:hypothetical protein K9M79_06305 [Candidatus Woesearchaeota archaeon]|nr:hypothetical protein [Candidatus Woesearchaeota archaeon]